MLSMAAASEVRPSDHAVGWYAIYTRHQHEKTVAGILTSKGFETLLPLYSAAHRWKDRTKLLSLPLFPCYVFLKGGLERRLDILTTPGIRALVSTAGQPAAIPHSEIEGVRRAVESGACVEPHPLLKCGEWVRVKYGPLQGIEGILVRKKNLYRLVLSVEILGKAASVEIDAFVIERMNYAASKMARFSTKFTNYQGPPSLRN
ncbi:MAG: antitermination protein NusG [Acidobacteria bacterium]|nr:MAG: antitermination protein NusG [Acidobacteriota bacterium]